MHSLEHEGARRAAFSPHTEKYLAHTGGVALFAADNTKRLMILSKTKSEVKTRA
jgi:hypothetical protein